MNRSASVCISPVCAGDAAFLCSLMNHPSVLRALNEVPTTQQGWADAIREWLSDEDEEDVIIIKDSSPIGWLGVNGLLENGKTVYLKMAALLPEAQGQGFDAQAIRALMRGLKLRGFQQMILYTDQENQQAQACYRKCGFEPVECLTEIMSNGRTVPRLRMEANL